MDLTAMQWLMVVFSAVIGIAVAIGLERFLRREVSAVPRMLMAVVAFLGISVLLSGLLVAPIGQAIGFSKPPAPAPAPAPGPVVQNEGYVMSVVTDKYAVPSAPLAGAAVSVSLTKPSPGAAIFPVASGTTDNQGACFFRIPGLTSGTVYVIAESSGYYSAVAQTVIPGAQMYPSEPLWAKIALAKVGTLSLTFENLTPGITYSSGTITLDNTRTSQEFRLTITTSQPATALKDLAVVLIRASTWANNNPTVSVTVEDSGGLSVSQSGNINTSVSQSINGVGDLTAEKVLKLRFRIVLTPSPGTNLMTISIDDLLGGVGYAGETGISPTWINVAVSS